MPFDDTTRDDTREALEIIEQMEELLSSRWRWIKHQSHIERSFPYSLFMPQHAYCLTGALIATGLDSPAMNRIDSSLDQVARHLGYMNAADFNDADETTYEMVMRVLKLVKLDLKAGARG